MTRPRQRAIAVASLVAAIAFLFAPTAAQAHSELVGSTPAADATLNKPPTQISLEFNEGVQQQGGAIVVTGADGARYDDASSFRASGTEATVDVDATSASGRVIVAYRVVSSDGHVVQGEYAFRIQGVTGNSPSPVATATPRSTPAAEDDGGNAAVVWVLGLGAIGIALIAAMVAVFSRRGRG